MAVVVACGIGRSRVDWHSRAQSKQSIAWVDPKLKCRTEITLDSNSRFVSASLRPALE
jgi:hypothetical protein